MISITVNSLPQMCPVHSTVAALLAQLGHAGKRLAVERNGQIIPRSQHASTLLCAGDTFEIVIAVGGG
jgi:sulfur carrier protein